MDNIWLWVGFNVFVLFMLALDLGVFNRKAHVISVREATFWSILWVVVALAFNVGVYYYMGAQTGLEFLTGYLIERALSIDNIFVFLLIFGYFRVPAKYQHRVLFLGIIGALVIRGAMIFAGAVLLERFEWIIYVFGAFLVITGLRMAVSKETNLEVEANPVLRLTRRFIPITSSYHGQHFLIKEERGGKLRWVATPLFVVLVMVETTDVVFALDSIPAIFAVTRDPFVVYSSNVFAILGLRALYFLLAGIIHKFHFLKLGLSVVLAFVGVKMLLTEIYHLPTGISLGVVAAVLAISIIASLIFPKEAAEHDPIEHGPFNPDDPIAEAQPDGLDAATRSADVP